MAVIQRSGKVKTQGTSPITLTLPNNIATTSSLVVAIISSYSGNATQTFSGSCGGTALAVATNGNHPNNVGAAAVLFLVDPPSGQSSVTVSSTNNQGYYTAVLLEVPKISGTSPINRQSAITTATIASSGGNGTITPDAGTTTVEKALAVTLWGASGATATTLGSAAAPSGYDLEFSENDDVNSQCGAGASQFLTSAQAVAPEWTVTASAGASQTTYLVGNTVVFELADQGGGTPPPDLSMGFSAIEPPDALALSCSVLSAPTVSWTFDSTAVTLDDSSLYGFDSGGAAPAMRTLAAALIDAPDLIAVSSIAQAALGRAATETADALDSQAASASALTAAAQEQADAPTLSSTAALIAAYAATELPDAVAAALLVQASAVLDIALQEAADALGASAATLSAAQALLAEAADGTTATAATAISASATLAESRDALAALLQAALGVAAASTEAPDALDARMVPIVQGAMYVDLAEAPDLLALAATAHSLAAAVLADGADALASTSATAAAMATTLAEQADATSAQLATEATAQIAVAVIESPDTLVSTAQGALLASAVLTTTDALQASANAAALANIATVGSADALAALLAQQPELATLDPRYIATLAARAFLAVRTARAFLAVRTARAYLAILRMGTTMTDQVEDKDPAEPAEITFSFDEALAPGVTLTGATVLAVQPLGGIDGAAATWGPALTATVGAIDGVVGGKTLPAGRYARVVVPPGAGLSGMRYLIAVQGATADPDVAPVCKAILPVVR